MLNFDARSTDSGVNTLFTQRWSPRAFQAHQIDSPTMQRIMDAARWSPSCFNAQPWRFYTSTESSFGDFLNLLVDANQSWAKNVSVIGFLVARKHFDYNGEPNSYCEFDSGAAWMAMTLQARMEGLYTHGLGGIKKNEAAKYLGIDTDQSEVLMGFTIGKLAALNELTEQQRQEETPNERLSLSEIWEQV